MKTNRKLITWKDADQNLCTLAAAILNQASNELRSVRKTTVPVPMTNGQLAPPGYAEQATNTGTAARVIFTGSRDKDATITTGIPGISEIEEEDNREDETKDDNLNFGNPSVLCWWSFQNIVRWELRKAREALWQNLYPQRRRQRADSGASRNPVKRQTKSKFGRTPER